MPPSGSTAGRAPPGNAGVPPATFFLAGGGGASAQRCSQAATLPACTALASPNERQGPATLPSQWRSRSRLCRATVRAGRPRSRVGILHTTNREHDLHPAQEWGKGPFASLKNHPRDRGRLARNLYSWLEEMERQRNVAGRQPSCRRERHGPVRMKGKAPLPFHPGGPVGLRCAGLLCGRDARVPGGPPLRGSRRSRAEWPRLMRWGVKAAPCKWLYKGRGSGGRRGRTRTMRGQSGGHVSPREGTTPHARISRTIRGSKLKVIFSLSPLRSKKSSSWWRPSR